MPKSMFLSDDNICLAVDLYELTMAAAYFDNRMNTRSTFDLFIRRLPENRGYLLNAGLEQAVHYLMNIHFPPESVEFLRTHPIFRNVSEGFFDYLAEFRFTGDLMAIPEGELVFPDEPILSVTAPIIEAQILETYLISVISFQTMVATKASRVVFAADGRGVVDFGSRRAHGPQAGLLAARASYIGGCTSTSNVLAGYETGIPIVGTVAHSWTMAFDSEMEAFRRYHDVFPDNTLLVIDTYDTITGAKRAMQIGPDLKGVRIDSGDLLKQSVEVRKLLDENGMNQVKIVASGDLNEYKIRDLLAQGAPIDLFGVGTEMVTSLDQPTLSAVYKLVEQEGTPKMKLSSSKVTYPSRKQVYRLTDADGMYERDIICKADETADGQALLIPIMRNGNLIADLPDVHQIRDRAIETLSRLPRRYREIENPPEYPVIRSEALERLKREVERDIIHSEEVDG